MTSHQAAVSEPARMPAPAAVQLALHDDPGRFLADLLPAQGPGAPDDGTLAVTRTFVCDPPFFGGGDIGRLAVCGTVNALAARGAEPRALTLGLTAEAGLPRDRLRQLADSVRHAAAEARVTVVDVHGRTVRAGDADQVYVTATAVGTAGRYRPPGPGAARPGDHIVVTGPLGDHEAHLLSLRAGLGYEHHIDGGCAPLSDLIALALATAGPGLRTVREPAEGGLATVLTEVATEARLTARIEEPDLPVRRITRLALDDLHRTPWSAASPGTLCLVVAPEVSPALLTALRGRPRARRAAVVGTLHREAEHRLVLRAGDGTTRPVRAGEAGAARVL
ncbi:AIR synthase-related protein [Streptomyces sp. S816]|uniref:AIR synthase-related protein n=1 Tax=Streptomyces sp. S816 TaxID=2283197 RepID=UPI00144AE465|nr:AIR synthase-related protein [Streptomyces sp. S816]